MATETGWDRDSWKKLNQELGLTAVHIPEEYGGQGFGCVELGIVLEEMGRALLCAPYFSSVVLARHRNSECWNGCAEAQAASIDRQRRHHRHPRLHRGQRPVGRLRRDDDRQPATS